MRRNPWILIMRPSPLFLPNYKGKEHLQLKIPNASKSIVLISYSTTRTPNNFILSYVHNLISTKLIFYSQNLVKDFWY